MALKSRIHRPRITPFKKQKKGRFSGTKEKKGGGGGGSTTNPTGIFDGCMYMVLETELNDGWIGRYFSRWVLFLK